MNKFFNNISITINNFFMCGSKTTKVIIVVLILTAAIHFHTFESNFVCNNSICQIHKKNIFGNHISNQNVYIHNIKRFESCLDNGATIFEHIMYMLEKHRSHTRNSDVRRFKVLAVKNNGSKYKFFPNTSSMTYTHNTVDILNNAIKDKSNINIEIKY